MDNVICEKPHYLVALQRLSYDCAMFHMFSNDCAMFHMFSNDCAMFHMVYLFKSSSEGEEELKRKIWRRRFEEEGLKRLPLQIFLFKSSNSNLPLQIFKRGRGRVDEEDLKRKIWRGFLFKSSNSNSLPISAQNTKDINSNFSMQAGLQQAHNAAVVESYI